MVVSEGGANSVANFGQETRVHQEKVHEFPEPMKWRQDSPNEGVRKRY